MEILIGLAVCGCLYCLLRILYSVKRILDETQKSRFVLEEQLRIQNLQGDTQLQMVPLLREISGHAYMVDTYLQERKYPHYNKMNYEALMSLVAKT